MQCDQVQSLLHRYVDGELNDSRAGAMEMHLAHCSACSLELERLRGLIDQTDHALSNSEAPPGFEAAVATALHERPKNQSGLLHNLRNLPKFLSNAIRCF